MTYADADFHVNNLQLIGHQDLENEGGEDQRVLLNVSDGSLHSFGVGYMATDAGLPGKGEIDQMPPQPNRSRPDPPIGAEAMAHNDMGSDASF